MASLLEAATSGVPLIVVGLFGDQMRNAEMMARHGSAIALKRTDLGDSNRLMKAVEQVLNDERFVPLDVLLLLSSENVLFPMRDRIKLPPKW